MDHDKVNAFSERLVAEVNTAMSCLNLYLGHRLGLYEAMAEAGPATAAELAAHTNYSERYLREWLACMAVGGYVHHDSETGRFTLPPEHGVVFLDEDDPAYAGPYVCLIPSFAGILNSLLQAFRTGGGVPFEAYGPDALEALGTTNRTMFVNDYVGKWLAVLPDTVQRLRAGGRVADIGCGTGWSSISLAMGFPDVRIDAVDSDRASLAAAQQNAAKMGIDERIAFHLSPVESAVLAPPYDLVTAFECIHDMAYPVAALRRMREIVADDGVVLIADEAAGDSIEENRSAIGHLFYNVSVLHCLPQAMVFPGSAATGTAMGTSTLRTYAQMAGFTSVSVLPIEHAFWRFYRLTP
jgi:2-polyprenyl-3-methyl-5-hydroxy-6-metoxy-1,4-benzoquinol methylase